jgi:CheY-like chemotaxis protein
VSAFSGGEGQGATFTIKLPIMIVHEMRRPQARSFEQMATSPSESVESECPPSLKGLRLLLVEDAPDARDLLTLMLEQCEAEVKAVESASQALAALEQWQPDLLVSDIEMPEEDGYSLIRKIRSMEARQGGRVPAVALTAHARTKDRMSALKAGFDAHVAKPFELEELITVIGSLARRSGRM